MLRKAVSAVILTCSVSVIGCATIVGDKTQLLSISSTPDQATISVTDEHGRAVYKGKTPSNVTLEKSDGGYWDKKSYTVTIAREGYETRTIPITASANGWYIAGNLVFGGLIGWFIVDPWNGAMYTLSPKDISESLSAQTSSSAKDGSISVLLLEDVPPSLRNKMKRIN